MSEIITLEALISILKGTNHELKINTLYEFEAQNRDAKHTFEPKLLDEATSGITHAAKSPQVNLSVAAVAVIGSLLHQLGTYHPQLLKAYSSVLFPALLDRLGDNKEKVRQEALRCLVELWQTIVVTADSGSITNTPKPNSKSLNAAQVAITYFEKEIKSHGFNHKTWRVREQLVSWILLCVKSIPDFSLKPYVPYMVKLLEDSQDPVRECSKEALVLLFSSAPPHIKQHLRKEMQKNKIRSGIAEYISSRVFNAATSEGNLSVPVSNLHKKRSRSSSDSSHSSSDISLADSETESHLSSTEIQSSGDLPTSGRSTPVASDIEVDAIQFYDSKEFENELLKIASKFNGKETEENWESREKALKRLSGIVHGDAPSKYNAVMAQGLRALLPKILDSIHTLRTTLAVTTLNLLQDMGKTLGTMLDPYLDITLTNLLKLGIQTKRIVAQASFKTTKVILRSTSYHGRTLNTLSAAMSDKNVQLRGFTVGYLKTILDTFESQAQTIERGGGLEILEKCIRKGIADANPQVRESSRDLFWTFWNIWKVRGEAIRNTLDPSTQKLLARQKSKSISGPYSAVKAQTPSTNRFGFDSKTTAKKKLMKSSTKIPSPTKLPPKPPQRFSPYEIPSTTLVENTSISEASPMDSPQPTNNMGQAHPAVTPVHRSIAALQLSPETELFLSKTPTLSPGNNQTPCYNEGQPPLLNYESSAEPTSAQPLKAHSDDTPSSPVESQMTPSRGGSPKDMKLPKPTTLSPDKINNPIFERNPSPTPSVTSGDISTPSGSSLSKRPSVNTPSRIDFFLRRLSLLDQLKHEDPAVRAAGVENIYLAYTGEQFTSKDSSGGLPDTEQVAPLLLDLLCQSEVQITQIFSRPEVMDVISQVVPMDQLLILLVCQLPDGGEAHYALEPFKSVVSKDECAHLLLEILQLLKTPGGLRGYRGGASTIAEKKRSLVRVIEWMEEILDFACRGNSEDEENLAKAYFSEKGCLKEYLMKMIDYFDSVPDTAPTFGIVRNFIVKLLNFDREASREVLSEVDSHLAKKIDALMAPDVEPSTTECNGVELHDSLQVTESVVVEEVVEIHQEKIDVVESMEINELPKDSINNDDVGELFERSELQLEEEEEEEEEALDDDDLQHTQYFDARDQQEEENEDAEDEDQEDMEADQPEEMETDKENVVPASSLTPQTNSKKRSASDALDDAEGNNAGSDRPATSISSSTDSIPSTPTRTLHDTLFEIPSYECDLSATNFDANAILQKRLDQMGAASPLPTAQQDQNELLHSLADRIASGSADTWTFRKLCRISRETPSAETQAKYIWIESDTITRILDSISSFLTNSSRPELKEHCLVLLKHLITYQSVFFTEPNVDAVLGLLLEHGSSSWAEPQYAAENAMESFIMFVSPQAGYTSLYNWLKKNIESESLPSMSTASAFHILKRLLLKVEVSSVNTTIEDVMQLVCRAWKSPKPVVRKSVVESMVSLCSVLDQSTLDEKVLPKLTLSQKKLLESYLKLSTS
ncbi:ARM repeat-containing protein [Basidiobolus meristosporus CBS 931.73]|uniref:ARM repeat-containing protein n=1 Tax=Basidiobolus meristosporus CBS 931.73 TaxID=1314790 RepID=A0A1Y1Z501_9FUNG|nr:ARM repeat-containing protein [Basidiobolus meristosporus CBS 931.73]|eukprot:ORY04895.1 ARM repeat-containing protein [Basidiobolus meristosporus CBS 931.73]